MYKQNDNKSIENIKYQETKLSKKGVSWELEKYWVPKVASYSPIYNDILTPFDNKKYLSPRLPIDLGPIDMKLIKDCPRILRMTIKEEGSLDIKIPKEIESVIPIIKRILNYEYMINDNLKDFNIHLTLDNGEIKKNSTQRFPGWHGDGLQGGKFKDKLVCEHSYIASSIFPTEICLQPFFLSHYDEDLYNYFKVFDLQAKETNIYKALANHIYLFDPYIVHRTPLITKDCFRSFIRITVANKELPIEFNTINPMFKGQNHAFKLDIRDSLVEPDTEIIFPYYGLDTKINREKVIKENIENKVNKEELENIVIKEQEVHSDNRPKIKQSESSFDEKEISDKGDEMIIKKKDFPIVDKYSPTYTDILEPFNLLKYTNPRLPIDLGVANLNEINQCPNVLRMPLKYHNSDLVKLPQNLKSIRNLIRRLFTYEQNINPYYKEMFAHITIDNRTIEPNTTQRFPGWHGDDLQGGSFDPKVLTAHSYIVTSSPSTELCLQPFFVAHLNDKFEKVFDEFDKQAKEENVYYTLPNHIYLVDPYNVHRSPIIEKPVNRTFLRITFSTHDMILPGNTVNPMFDNKDYPGNNAVHKDESWWVVTPDKEVPYNYYGLSD